MQSGLQQSWSLPDYRLLNTEYLTLYISDYLRTLLFRIVSPCSIITASTVGSMTIILVAVVIAVAVTHRVSVPQAIAVIA